MKPQSFHLCIPKYHLFSKKVVCLPYISFKFSPLFGEYGNKLARKNNNSWLLFSKSAKKVSVSWGFLITNFVFIFLNAKNSAEGSNMVAKNIQACFNVLPLIFFLTKYG